MEENYRIQQLIESKSFNALSNEEKTLVLSELTEEEYNVRKSMIDHTRLFLTSEVNNMQPDDHIKNRAIALLKERKANEKKPLLYMIIQYKIPAFIPAAAAVVLLFMLPFAFNSESKIEYIVSATDTIHKTVYKTDTIVLEKEVIKEVKMPVVKYVKVEAPRTTYVLNNNQGTDRVVKADPQTMVETTRTQLENQLKLSGKSSGDMNELNSLIQMNDKFVYRP